jgi:general secretion pathway protein H
MRLRQPIARAGRVAGFTLLELLVVLIILAAMVSLVGVNLAPDARQVLREEASRLALLLGHARDEAITTGVALAWQGTDDGYRFVRRAVDRTWQRVDADDALRARTLPAGVSLARIDVTTQMPGRAPVIVLPPNGIIEPFRITLASGEHRVSVRSDGFGAPVLEDVGGDER